MNYRKEERCTVNGKNLKERDIQRSSDLNYTITHSDFCIFRKNSPSPHFDKKKKKKKKKEAVLTYPYPTNVYAGAATD